MESRVSADSWGGIFLLLCGLGKPGTHQAEVSNSLFHTTCLKAAGVRQPGGIFKLTRPDELYPGLLRR